MFEILRVNHNMTITDWLRFTDGCGAQFRSRFVNADLINAKSLFKLNNVGFEYFEANEGKSVSDTIGSVVKCAFVRAMYKQDQGVSNAGHVLQLINSEVSECTKKFDFFIVEEFPSINRVSEREEYKLNGIMSMHSLRVKTDGILAQERSCVECSPNNFCDKCDAKSVTLSCADDEDTEDMPQIVDNDDEATDYSGSESEDENDGIAPGDIVWGKYGKYWYPGKVVPQQDVPIEHHNFLRCNDSHKVVVKWYGENSFSKIKINNLDLLAENKVDAARAARSSYIHECYQLALSDLRQD